MSVNVNTIERIIRTVIGLALICWAIFFPQSPYSPLGWFGVILVATGLLGWCAIYRILGISTAKK